MAARQNKRAPSKRNTRGAGGQTGERPVQTWRQPPPTPRQKMVRKKMDVAPVSRTRAATPGWRAWARRINWPQVLALVFLMLLTGGLVWGATVGPFQVSASTIEVNGNRRLEAWEVARAADIDGANTFAVLPGDVAKRVGKLPGVNEVTVKVRLPNRVIVQVKEFMPLVAWQTPEGTRWLSEDGALIPVSGESPALILIDPQGDAADENGNLQAGILSGLAVIEKLRPDLRELYFGKLEGLYFRSPEGWTVYLGEDGRMERKLAILESMKPTLTDGNSQARVLDLRFEEFPTFR